MKPVIIIAIAFVLLIPIPVFALEYYENESHEFSFNIPSTWDYEENKEVYENIPLFQVWFYVPDDIIVTNDYPSIGVMYEFISSSSVSTFNERTVENYVSEQIITSIPDGRLTSSDVESKSWGWVVSTEFFENVENGETFTVFYDMKSYFFKNGDLYNLEYAAGERYFDTYYPEYETVLGSLVIKGTEVNKLEIIPVSSGSSGTSSESFPTDYVIVGIVIAVIAAGIGIALSKRKKTAAIPAQPAKAQTAKTKDETQFWVCPNCGRDTQMKEGRQYCSSCKFYLSI